MQLPERVSIPVTPSDFDDIIDVRAPSEFKEDHIPGAINLPVLTDEQHHEVGLLHASSPFEARRLGATLITENIHLHLKNHLSQKNSEFAPLLYCWRGNMRSNSMAVVFRSIGWRARILNGGYKAWRKWLITDLSRSISSSKPELIVLGGLTGCGKTRLLHELKKQGAQILDLEGLANHRGSILGNAPDSAQPTQRRFDSLLWSAFQDYDPNRPVFTEAESNRIGRLQLPASLWKRLGESRLVLLDLPLPERARILADDYRHFIDDPNSLKETLSGLTRLRGKTLIETWFQQIDSSDWSSFLQSILIDHYDLAYRRPGSDDSFYPEPECTISPESCADKNFQHSAKELIDRFQAC